MNEQFVDIMNFQILGPRVIHWIMIGFLVLILKPRRNGVQNER